MDKFTRFSRMVAVMAALSFGLAGCGSEIAKEQLAAGILPPVVNPITEVNRSLRDLPPPSQKIPVAVYNYADQTGQFKPSETTQTLSRAVTQGATSILIKSLQDVGEGSWFTVVERERIDNLLKERQIITQMRMTYLGEKGVNPDALPPLLFAAIIFEGGIIGYDSNIQTGGVGARLLGIGGDVKYRLDTITIYLRAVSTKTGQVLASVTTHKTIASVGLQGGVFKFIAVDKILEAEAGFTKNEPDQLAVQQAIEKAVYSMLMEGAEKSIWSFADETKAAKLVGAYKAGEVPEIHNSADLAPASIPSKAALEPETATATNEDQAPIFASVDVPEKAPDDSRVADSSYSTVADEQSSGIARATTPGKNAENAWQTSLADSPLPKKPSADSFDPIRPLVPPNPVPRPRTTAIATVEGHFTHMASRN